MICVIHAHPYPLRSRANRLLADALRGSPNLELRSLYDSYPDFDIDVLAEQRALEQAKLVVWMHPLFWYSVPALLKHWFDKVLAFGWAYGEGGTALRGKHCLWVPTTSGSDGEFTNDGLHARAFEEFSAPIEQTARFCGMEWEAPYVIYGANTLDEARLKEHAVKLNERMAQWREPADSSVAEATP
jgi:glutathione-regulated potassium-efflux system ancillary protein KefF